MTLHIISKSPFTSSALTDCSASCAGGDVILLIEDGVYAALEVQAPQLAQAAASAVYCLKSDATARGIDIAPGVNAIDEAQWVALCAEHNPIVSWFK